MIRFEDFSWQFAESRRAALTGVDLSIQPGEFVAVTGPSGSGKTTLALAMCGLLIDHQSGHARGTVHVGGLDVATTPVHRIAREIGLVQQNPEVHFATLTVENELAFGLENRRADPAEIARAMDEALRLLGITHLRDRELTTLSGGEQQRVAVASLLAGRPAALVLDEPTASLDPGAALALFETLAELRRETGLTVVIIEHKLAHLLPLRPRLIRMDAGRIVADIPAGEASAATEAVTPRTLAANVTTCHVTCPVDIDARELAAPLVEVDSLTVEVAGSKILDDVSLRVRTGQVVAIMGPNGGGKSTLLHSLMGLTKPAGGTVRVCGEVANAAAVSRLARRVGLVFQNADHQLVTDGVRAEALFACRNFDMVTESCEREATRLLERAGLGDRATDHPFRLSWGQKRRLNVISALLHRPRLLLLDEPFAGQDWENVEFVLDVVARVLAAQPAAEARDCGAAERGACLMVTHDPRIVLRACDRLLFMDAGRLIVDAPVQQAFEQLRELGHTAYLPAPGADDQPPAATPPQ